MLNVDELVRDVLCAELIQIDALVKSLSCTQQQELLLHISNMKSILMSEVDFVQVSEEKGK